jgi:uncharacterized membrane protein
VRNSIALLCFLSTAGLANALYFTLAYYGLIQAHSRLVPSVFCNTEESKCLNVLGTPYARVFWVPNSLLGVLYYLAVLGFVAWEALVDVPLPILNAYLGVAAFTVAFGIYLTYALFFRIKIPCPLCLTGHGINLAIAAIVVWIRII